MNTMAGGDWEDLDASPGFERRRMGVDFVSEKIGLKIARETAKERGRRGDDIGPRRQPSASVQFPRGFGAHRQSHGFIWWGLNWITRHLQPASNPKIPHGKKEKTHSRKEIQISTVKIKFKSGVERSAHKTNDDLR